MDLRVGVCAVAGTSGGHSIGVYSPNGFLRRPLRWSRPIDWNIFIVVNSVYCATKSVGIL
jgi:hypothetical protein